MRSSSAFLICWLFCLTSIKAQLDSTTIKEYQLHTVSIVASSGKIGSGIILKQISDKFIVATAKHLFEGGGIQSDSTHEVRLFQSNESKRITFEFVYKDPNPKMDLALFVFQTEDFNVSSIPFDSSHDLSDHFYLVSTLEDWRLIPPISRVSTLLAINSDRSKAKLHMEGIIDGHSGSGYFTKDGVSGIVYFQEGALNAVRTITIQYIEALLLEFERKIK